MGALIGLTMWLTTAAGPDVGGIVPEKLYHGVGQPVMVKIGSLQATESITLVLMRADGELVAPPREVRPGRVDLGEVLPEIWTIRRACYVQRMDDRQRVGTAVVVGPMLSRIEPRTEQDVRHDGSMYTRIVGWGEPPEGAEGTSTDGEPFWNVPDHKRVFSGLRVYLERDVVLVTNKGDIVLAMRPDEAPNTVWNFRQLVAGGFYDGVIFHRVVPLTRRGRPFVIQGGDPTGGGEGGPGYWLPLEPSRLPHGFGVISMARADHPDSAGSQFFICLSREGTARLDGQYCAFGYAVEGADTIRAIAAVKLADPARGRPARPPIIQWAELVASPPRVPGEGRPDSPVSRHQERPQTQPDRVPR